jgi:hypothetical protein
VYTVASFVILASTTGTRVLAFTQAHYSIRIDWGICGKLGNAMKTLRLICFASRGDFALGGWVEKALHRGELKITDNRICPFCNPELESDGAAKINVCECHKWANREWFRNRFPSEYEVIAKDIEKQG